MTMAMTLLELPERIRNKIQPEPNSGCWLWTGCLTDRGYPNGTVRYKSYRMHRYIYRLFKDDLGSELHHVCRTKCCVNPSHLQNVTKSENCRQRPRITHCKNGHLLAGDNVRYRNDGSRRCKICQAEAGRIRYQMRKLNGRL